MFAIVPELKIIKKALTIIDFELNDNDKNYFYVYVLNKLFNKEYPYPYDYEYEYRPPKYFKLLLKQIEPYCITI